MDSILTPPANPYKSGINDNEEIWTLYKDHIASIWLPEKFVFEQDLSDWLNKMNNEERNFVKFILAFFASADILVGNNINKMFTQEVTLDSSKYFYTFQAFMENVHNETYRKMLDCYVSDPSEREQLENGAQNIPCIKKKIQWAEKWMNDSRSFAERLVAFVCVEGIHFCSSFAGIYWIKERGLMKQLAESNEYIARDENLHVVHGICLYKLLDNKPSVERVHDIFREAVELEIEFCTDAIPCRFIGLNAPMMQQYIRFLANQFLLQMGVEILYKDDKVNPFPWMKLMEVKNSKNFFEVEPVDYRLISKGDERDIWG